MVTKISPYSVLPENLALPCHIKDVPIAIILEIFKKLNFKDLFFVSFVCRSWNETARDPKTEYGECVSIRKIPSTTPRYSAWETLPKHWNKGEYWKGGYIRFFSIFQDILTIKKCPLHPSRDEFSYSTKFFSFASDISCFSDRNIFFGREGSRYFFTPQSTSREVRLVDEGVAGSTTSSQLASYQLIVLDTKNPEQKIEFSPYEHSQIWHCIPLSERKVVILTFKGNVGLWDLSGDGTPILLKSAQITSATLIYRFKNWLVFGKEIMNLEDLSLTQHELKAYDHKPHELVYGHKSYGSSLCIWDQISFDNPPVGYFVLKRDGTLEKKWILTSRNIKKMLDLPSNEEIETSVEDLNDKFVLLSCGSVKGVYLLVLDTTGKKIYSIKEQYPNDDGQPVWHLKREYPTFAHLSGDILIYKKIQEGSIEFWHLPTAKRFCTVPAKQFNGLSKEGAKICDIRFVEGKLNFLFATPHNPDENHLGQARVIQFDPSYKAESSESLYSYFYSIFSRNPTRSLTTLVSNFLGFSK